MVSSGEDGLDEVASDKLQHEPGPVSETRALQSDQEVSTLILSRKSLMLPDTGHLLPSDQERSISSITSEKASQTTDIIPALQTGQEVSTPTIREKVSEDGYNWRKYGQKLVRGNEFVRSYYKCTHPRCLAKKQLDCTHEGQIVDTIYSGDHCHPKVPNVPLAVGIVVSVVEEKPEVSSISSAKDKSSDTHGQTPRQTERNDNSRLSVAAASGGMKDPLISNRMKDEVDNDDRPGSKRRKKDNFNANASPVEKLTGEHRVVQTLSEVDFVNDGYRWRKYGQKLVKGNPNPRNYYRCSNSGCPAKKHVERASHDPKLVITTYEGRHDHDMPPSRTVTPNVAGTKNSKTAHNGESAKLEEIDAVCSDTDVHRSSDTLSKSTEGKNGEPKTKSEATATASVGLVKSELSAVHPESKSSEPQNGNSRTIEGSDVAHGRSCHKGSSNDQSNCESETKSEQNGTACRDKVIQATSLPDANYGEQEQTPKAVKALVDLIFKWSSGGDGVLERAAGALANLAADDKCSMEVALAGGVHALVMLARSCKFEGVQEQAARALANLAAHGDSNSNNSAVGQEAGALEALVQLTRSPHEGVRQEAAGALWNLSFDDRNREAIAAAGGVEALVVLAQSCSNASPGLQERAAGALWGLSVSEANCIAIGREGGVAPLIALARSEAEDVHETAAGALWNLAFNPGNALRIVEEGGVPALVHLCSSSGSKMARFMAALALAYMFDGRMDEFALIGTSTESTSKCVSLDGARRMALKHIEAFVLTFSDPQAFATAAASSAPAALTQVTERARIQEAGHLRCSGAEIGRFITMLRNPSSVLKSCAAFALLQFTIPGGRHAMHHASLMQGAGAARVLRAAAAAAAAPIEAKIFARIVLRNLEHHHHVELSI